MVANFERSRRQSMSIIDVDGTNPPTTQAFLEQLKLSLAKQSLFDQLDALSRSPVEFLGSGCYLQLSPSAFSAYAVWALDWVMVDDRRSYSANFSGGCSFVVGFGGRPLLIVERAVTA